MTSGRASGSGMADEPEQPVHAEDRASHQQGFERAERQLVDAEMLAGHVVPENSMFAFLATTGPRCSPTPITRTCSRQGVGRRR